MRELMVRDAIREALDEEMARDNTVFQMGEDIGVIGGNFKCTVGLRDKYGDLRVKDTPISEQGFVGMGVGAALTGLRPVVELMFADFMMVCGDQLFNQMAKITYMSGGQCNVPMVVRLPLGGGRSSAAQHSQSIHAWAAHIPGVKVVVPSTAGECKGLLKTAIRDNDPVMFFEHKMLYTTKFNDVLAQIDGVGEVRVVLTLQSGPRRILAQDSQSTVDEGRTEAEVTNVVISAGSGVEGTVTLQQLSPQFQGALVVCSGGGEPTVQLRLVEAVSALTGLGADKISVCKGK